MNPLLFRLPLGCKIEFNYLYPTTDPLALTQDIALISVPNGIFIDVGWYPEHDLQGEYRISVYRNEWHNQLIEPVRTASVTMVANEIERLASMFASHGVTTVYWGEVIINQTATRSASSTGFRRIAQHA